MSFISFLIVEAVVFGLAILFKHRGMRFLQLVFGAIFFGIIGGCITNWIFDSFGWGFVLAGGAFGLSALGDSGESSQSSSGASYGGYDINQFRTDYRPSQSSGNYEELERESRRQSERSDYERRADYAYQQYQSYMSQAESKERHAQGLLSEAEDYEYRAREYDEDSSRSLANTYRSRAQSRLDQARDYRSRADDYYREYQEYKDRARMC